MSSSNKLLVLVLSGCNAIYGIGKAEEVALHYDAPTDAPFMCPAIGATPQFSPLFHQLFTQSCHDYTVSPDGSAFAVCGEPGSETMYGGTAGSPLAPLVGLPLAPYFDGRITTDGMHVLAIMTIGAALPTIHAYERGSSSWSEIAAPPIQPALSTIASNFAAGPDGQIVFTYDSLGTHEWHFDTSWLEVPSVVELDSYLTMTMTTDGMRALIVEPEGTFYTDRIDTRSPFRTPVFAFNSPYIFHAPFMSNDCARIYFTGLGTVGYIQQL